MNMDDILFDVTESLQMPNSKKAWLSAVNATLSGDLRELVLSTPIPDYFWSIPSSSSGKYHPEDEICEGGLVRHTLKTVKVAKDTMAVIKDMLSTNIEILNEEYDYVGQLLTLAGNISKKDREYAIAALFLHDSYKNGNPNVGHTIHEHPIVAAQAVSKVLNPCANIVARLIVSHMGRWNTSKYSEVILPTPEDDLQKFVHLCDYIASRKAWDIKI